MASGHRLSTLEASFIALERPGLPIHVGGLLLLDGGKPVGLPQLRRIIASRIRPFPKFQERVGAAPLGLTRAQWVPVQRQALGAHVFDHRLRAPGSSRQLQALAGRIHQHPLDRSRPLWEVHLIDGLEGGRQAVMVKLHHAMADGIAAIALAERVAEDPANRRKRAHGRRPVVGDCTPGSTLQRLLGIASTAAAGPIAAAGPFNGPVGAERAFVAATIPMATIRQAKRVLGGTVDDVVLTVVSAALRSYLLDVRYPDIPRTLRAMIPVSTRGSSRSIDLDNRITSVFIDLPLNAEEFPQRLRRIAGLKSGARGAHAGPGASFVIEAIGALPNPVHEAVVRTAAGFNFAHLIVSDIPGPGEPLHMFGRRVVAAYPLMPLAPTVGLAIAALSVGETMGVGVTADPGLVPEPRLIARSIERVVADLDRSLREHGGGAESTAA